MIPRAARRGEKTYCRKTLPRPARFYSTATKRNDFPALATQKTLPSADYPLLKPTFEKSTDTPLFPGDMQSFLKRGTSYTLLPTPLRTDRSSTVNDFYFTDSHTQDLFAVICACLHNLYDVPRAKQIFARLRSTKTSDPLLVPQLYNSFLETYLNMATTKNTDESERWIYDAWVLYNSMEKGTEGVSPTAGTYAVMLLAWSR